MRTTPHESWLHGSADSCGQGYAKLSGSRFSEFAIDIGLLSETTSQLQVFFLLCDAVKTAGLFEILRYQSHATVPVLVRQVAADMAR